jgi:prolyl oligopeptidase
MDDGGVKAVEQPQLAWNPDDYMTEQVFVTSADGTRVPLFLSHRRDVPPSGEVPTLLYGYGGFQVSIGPIFKPEWLAWMERGGLLAVASLRGGGEYGRAWHDAGRLTNKQNVFDDFAACARWLAASGWTRPERIGISGRSNGGLLVGASITQHPELFGAAIAEVGVMDMLRFHRFTIGWGWTSDYGSADDPEQFRTLRAYSPLHNIRDGTDYPPTLVTTAYHDDRVVPAHSFKFAAALQAATAGEAPVLIRIDTDAGHGLGKPVSKLIDERADVLAFLQRALAG